MFEKLKERLKNWTKKLTEKAKPVEEEEKSLEKIEEISKEKPIKEINVPMEFNVGTQSFEPDLEKLKEIKKDIKKNKEEPKPGTESFFKKITSKLTKVKISEKEFEVYSEDLEMLLLENNVALEVSEKIIQELKEKIIGREFLKKEAEQEVLETLKNIIKDILIEPFDLLKKIKEKAQDQSKDPYVILFCGINGTGKTTTIAKIADLFKRNNTTCVLAAADTFRAASIEQIKEHGDKINVKVISQEYGSDPASVGFDAIKYAKKNLINCVLIDTAGRMHTSKNLLNEIKKIVRVCKPDTKIFVGESLTGNDAIEQIKTFDWAIGIDGIILTKADIDDKGGTALSVGYVTKKPILYLGTGQEYNKIVVFNKEKFIESLGL